MTYEKAIDSQAARAAEERLGKYVDLGKHQGMQLLRAIQNNVITPYRVYTGNMHFQPAEKAGLPPTYSVQLDEGAYTWSLHRHALSQMAGEVSIPLTFVHTLTTGEDWERRELTDLLNERFHKLPFKQRGGGSPRFVSLVVGTQVRGFVSRSFKRYLKSGPIFEAFVKACGLFQAMPVEALTSELAFTLRCVLPYVFELKRGSHVALGVSCSNSDFGAGIFKIGFTVMNLQTGIVSYVKDLKKEKHVGEAERDSGQSEVLSDATIEKKIVATQSEVKDVVESALHPDKINHFLGLVRRSMEVEISWPKLVAYLQGRLPVEDIRMMEETLKDRAKSQEIADMRYDIDGDAIINLWWGANAIATQASKYEGDKKEDLQTLAGQLLLKA